MLKCSPLSWHNVPRLTRFAGPAVLDQALVSGLNFVLAIYLARAFGFSVFGQYSILLLIILFCLDVQRALIVAPMLNFYKTQSDSFSYMQTLQGQQTIISLTIALLAALFIASTNYFIPIWQIAAHAPIMFFLISARLYQEYLRRYFFVSQNEKKALKLDFLTGLLQLSSIAYLTYTEKLNLQNLLLLLTLAYALPALLFGLNKSSYKINYNGGILNKHWHFGKWLLASAIVTYASGNYFVLSGAKLLGPEAAGVIKTTQYIMGAMAILYQASENIIPAHLSELVHNKNWNKAKIFVVNSIALFTLAAITQTLLIDYFLPHIGRILNTEITTEFKSIVALNALLVFILISGCHLQYLLRSFSCNKITFLANVTTAIFSVILAPYIINSFGLKGVMYGLIMCQLISQLIMLKAFLKIWKDKT